MGRRERVGALERRVRPQPEPSFEYYERSLRAWDELLLTMAPEHVAIIAADLLTRDHARLDPDGHLVAARDASRLTRLVSSMVWQRARGTYKARYALPGPVAQVYVDEPDALPLHTCQDCWLAVPIRPGLAQPARSAISYFDTCPLCGGRVGYGQPWAKKLGPA